jgi:hypothetical protein
MRIRRKRSGGEIFARRGDAETGDPSNVDRGGQKGGGASSSGTEPERGSSSSETGESPSKLWDSKNKKGIFEIMRTEKINLPQKAEHRISLLPIPLPPPPRRKWIQRLNSLQICCRVLDTRKWGIRSGCSDCIADRKNWRLGGE